MPLRDATWESPSWLTRLYFLTDVRHQKVRKLNLNLGKKKQMHHLFVQEVQVLGFKLTMWILQDITQISHLFYVEELSLAQWNHRVWNIILLCSRNKVTITKGIHKFWWTWLMLFLQLPLDYRLWINKSSLAKLLSFKKNLLNWKQCQISAILEALY